MTNKEKLERIIDLCTIGLKHPDMSDRLLRHVNELLNIEVLTEHEILLGQYISKVKAVQAYKNRTGFSLIQSKDAVESYFQNHNLKFKGVE